MSSRRGADRLSLLPDDILGHILSFVPETEERARTSLLSKRFRRLWLHQRSICLGSGDEFMFLDDSDPECAADVSRYVSSVDACLSSLRSPLLQTLDLRLCSAFPNSTSLSDRWIRFAADRSVRELSLRSLYRRPELPLAVYSCRLLTSLSINCDVPYLPPNFTGFPLLVDLKLDSTISDQTLTNFLSKSPSLRALTLHTCWGLEVLELSSKILSRVSIRRCGQLESVRLDTPNLVSFAYDGVANILRLKNASHLLDATVKMDEYSHPSALTTDICHVSRRLKVSGWLFEFLLPRSLNPVFSNLKELRCQIKFLTAAKLNSLVSVLGNCPNLEQLYLSFRRRKYNLRNKRILDNFSMSERGSGPCLDRLEKMKLVIEELIEELTHNREHQVWNQSEATNGFQAARHGLKFVVLKKFLGTANEMKLIEYLLGTGSALKKLTIDDSLMREEREIVKMLARMPRASPHLRIHKMIEELDI